MDENESGSRDRECFAPCSVNSIDLPDEYSHSLEDSTDPDCLVIEEPTEEEVALAMRLSTSCDMPVGNREDFCVIERTSQGEDIGSLEKDANKQNDEMTPCSTCGSLDEPHFLHYKKLQTARLTRGCFIWRYRCSSGECAQFFGDFYAYDKSSNSFVRVSEDGSSLHEEDTGNEDGESSIAVVSSEVQPMNVNKPEQPLEREVENDIGNAATPPLLPHLGRIEGVNELPVLLGSGQRVSAVGTEKTVNIPVSDSRSRRRQRATARKKTAVVLAKASPNTKKADKNATDRTLRVAAVVPSKPSSKANGRAPPKAPPKAPPRNSKGSSKLSVKCSKAPTSKRKREKAVDPVLAVGTPSKRARKGYVYEVISPPLVHTSVNTVDVVSSTYPCLPTTSHAESATQTMGGTHYFSVLLEQLINDQAELISGSTSEVPLSLPTHVSRRLMISQHLLKRQSEQLLEACKENERLMSLVNLMNTMIKKFRDEYTPELRNLRDAITVLKNDFSFYQEEFVTEAKKSIDNINAQQDKVQQKMDDVDRKNRLLSARIDLHVKEKEAVEERADGYLRDICARDRDVILANKARDKAERKLNDTLYVANNAKCAHCQISDKMRKHLTDVVAEKTVLLEKCQKECIDAKRRAEQADRISQILSKDSEKLKFELSRWKSDAERNITEITRLKEELRKTSTPTIFDKAMPNSSQPRIDIVNTKDSSFVTGVSPNNLSEKFPAVSDTKARNPSPNGSLKASENADEELLRPPPVPPIIPTPPEEPDSLPGSCSLKERKPERSPPVSFFNSPSATSRHITLSSSIQRSHPFNGPLINSNNLSGRANDCNSSPSNSGATNVTHRNDEKVKGIIPSKAAEMMQISLMKDGGLQHNRNDELCLQDSAPMIGKLPSKLCKKNAKLESSSSYIQKTNADASQQVTDGRLQSKILPATAKIVGKLGKGKNKRKKLLGKQVPRTKAVSSLMSLQGPPPFNGPVSFFGSSTSACKKSSEPHSSETIRSRFSSSPLPWHRGEATMDYSVWEGGGYHPEPSSPLYERRTDLLSGRPFVQRPRKNYWDP